MVRKLVTNARLRHMRCLVLCTADTKHIVLLTLVCSNPKVNMQHKETFHGMERIEDLFKALIHIFKKDCFRIKTTIPAVKFSDNLLLIAHYNHPH